MTIQGDGQTINMIKNIFLCPAKGDEQLEDWKEELASIAAEWPHGEGELKPLIRFLVMAIHPAKIYQLKHAATQGATGSFIDFLLVLEGENTASFSEPELVLEMPYIKGQTVSCSLHNEANVLEALETGHVFYSRHCKPGNLIYDDGKETYPVTPPEVLAAIKQKIRTGFNRSIEKALDFSEAAGYFLDTRYSDITPFLLHQAAELTYRAVLNHLSGYDKKTHEIRTLKKYVRCYAPPLCNIFSDNTKEESRLLDLLESAYLKARYEQEYLVSETDLSKLFNKVTLLLESAIAVVSGETE